MLHLGFFLVVPLLPTSCDIPFVSADVSEEQVATSILSGLTCNQAPKLKRGRRRATLYESQRRACHCVLPLPMLCDSDDALGALMHDSLTGRQTALCLGCDDAGC